MYENNVAENNQKEEDSFKQYTPLRKCNEEFISRRGGLMFGELAAPEEGVELSERNVK